MTMKLSIKLSKTEYLKFIILVMAEPRTELGTKGAEHACLINPEFSPEAGDNLRIISKVS